MSIRFPGWLLGILLTVIVVTAVGLTALALEHVRGQPMTGVKTSVPPPTAAPSDEATPTPSPAAEATPFAISYEGSQERFLTASAGVLWRGTAGRCGSDSPLIERSVDMGSAWTDVTPTYRELAQLIALDPSADGQAEIISLAGPGCPVQGFRTFTQGEFWDPYPDVMSNAQYIDPASPGSVLAAAGPVAAPCPDARNLRAEADMLAVICGGTAFRSGQDSDWIELAPRVAALDFDEGDIIIAHESAPCPGLTLSRITLGDSRPTGIGCVENADPLAPTAVTVFGDDVVLWSGEITTAVTKRPA